MRSRMIWMMFASGVVLIGIGLMHLSLSALQGPGPLETRMANLGKRSVIRLASRQGIPPRPLDAKARLKREVHITAWIAAYAMASMAGLKRPRDNGCIHVPRI